MINLSSVVHSAAFAQDFSILRAFGEWIDGAFVPGEPETIPFHGIITVANASDLSAVPEADRRGGGMRILTTEPVYETGANGSNASDILLWNGARYKIMSVTPDKDWGFYRAIATRLYDE